MGGGDDPDNRRDFPGGFAGDTRNAFTREGRTADEESVFAYTQALLRLRREHPALTKGTLNHISVAKNHYAFLRESGSDRLLVVFNCSDDLETLSLDLTDTPLEGAKGLESLLDAGPAQVRDGQGSVATRPMSVSIYRVR
jgi:glycosidase